MARGDGVVSDGISSDAIDNEIPEISTRTFQKQLISNQNCGNLLDEFEIYRRMKFKLCHHRNANRRKRRLAGIASEMIVVASVNTASN